MYCRQGDGVDAAYDGGSVDWYNCLCILDFFH